MNVENMVPGGVLIAIVGAVLYVAATGGVAGTATARPETAVAEDVMRVSERDMATCLDRLHLATDAQYARMMGVSYRTHAALTAQTTMGRSLEQNELDRVLIRGYLAETAREAQVRGLWECVHWTARRKAMAARPAG